MPYTIAAIADIHAGDRNPVECPRRCCTRAESLLSRAVHQINREIKPDATVILGDLANDGRGPEAVAVYRRLRRILDQIASPLLVLPGNHDGSPEAFYRTFPRPSAVTDIGAVRFLPFFDPEEPGYHARRTAADLARMTAARDGFDGMIVTLQHVPLLPPGRGASPYRYTNAREVVAQMHAAGITLAISGHYHEGEATIFDETGAYIVAPALCEAPFAFLTITLDDDAVTVIRHELGTL